MKKNTKWILGISAAIGLAFFAYNSFSTSTESQIQVETVLAQKGGCDHHGHRYWNH